VRLQPDGLAAATDRVVVTDQDQQALGPVPRYAPASEGSAVTALGGGQRARVVALHPQQIAEEGQQVGVRRAVGEPAPDGFARRRPAPGAGSARTCRSVRHSSLRFSGTWPGRRTAALVGEHRHVAAAPKPGIRGRADLRGRGQHVGLGDHRISPVAIESRIANSAGGLADVARSAPE